MMNQSGAGAERFRSLAGESGPGVERAGAQQSTGAQPAAGPEQRISFRASPINSGEPYQRDLISIGECLVELSHRSDGAWNASIAGDAFNTLFYAARLGLSTGFVSAVGDDLFTPMIVERIASEGIDITHVQRLSGRRNGIYFIENDSWGERIFHYWREGSAATETMYVHDDRRIAPYLAGARVVFVSGVTLATLRRPDRLMDRLREIPGETLLAFDPNYRASLWRSVADFRARSREIMPLVDIYLPSRQDLLSGWDGRDPDEHVLEAYSAGTKVVVLKDGAAGALFVDGGTLRHSPGREALHIVDTTGAGDAFNAGLIAGLLQGHTLEGACTRANAVAARTLMVQGAIDPAFAWVGV